MSALQTLAKPRRIKATHRRRRRIASGRFVQRYMDQEIGRFLTPDPVGPEEDFINHFNRYNYAQNNPVRYTDPDGRTGRNPADPFPCPQSRNPASCPGGLSNTLPLDGAKKEKPPTPTPPVAAAAAAAAAAPAAPAAPKPDEEGYWDRVNERFMETNREIPGMIALPGMGIISAGAAARAVGAQTLMQAAGNQVANGLVNYAGAIPAPVNWAGAFQGAALNFVAVGVSFEVGLYVGSAIYVAGSDAFFGPPANLSIDCKCQEGK